MQLDSYDSNRSVMDQLVDEDAYKQANLSDYIEVYDPQDPSIKIARI